MPNPRVNLTGETYVTDGLRLVLFLNEPRQPFNQIDFLDARFPLAITAIAKVQWH
jgi:hypothetical protein